MRTRKASLSVTEGGKVQLNVGEAKRAHFWNLAFPAIRLLVLAALFVIFGVIQSSRAYTVIGSVFGAFIFSVAGVSLWVGCVGISEAYSSVRENFPDRRQSIADVDDVIKAIITDSRVVDERFVEYRIDVSVSARHWFVWRRYSDFYKTFKEESSFAKTVPQIMLPSKAWFSNQLSAEFIAERKELLNEYIQNLLCEHGPRRVDAAMADFFGL